jgi:hypothetical protein
MKSFSATLVDLPRLNFDDHNHICFLTYCVPSMFTHQVLITSVTLTWSIRLASYKCNRRSIFESTIVIANPPSLQIFKC